LSSRFGDVMVKTPVLILVSFLIFFSCAARQKGTIPSKASIDIVIDELASELTDSLPPEKRPKIAVADLLGPVSDHTQLGSFISEKLMTRLFLSGRFEKVLERKLLGDLLALQRIEMEGYFDEDTIKSLCGKIGVDAVLMGFITDCGSSIDVNVRFIDTNGEILSVAETQFDKDGVQGMLEASKKATLTVVLGPPDVEACVTVSDKALKSVNRVAVFRDIPRGNRTIVIAAKGYETVQESVYLTGDRTITVYLTPKKITLTVRITPPQGEIIVDGETRGKACEGVMVLRDVPSGKHTILAQAEGYLPKQRQIELYEDKAISINLSCIYRHLTNAKEAGPLGDPMVIHVIPLNYASAEQLASVVAPLLSREGRVVAYRPTNSLIIRDRASLVKGLVKSIKRNAHL